MAADRQLDRRELRVQRRVAGPTSRVFARFVDQVDAWWRQGPRFRRLPAGRMRFTRSALVEEDDEQTIVVARLVALQPPERLELELDGAPVVVTFVPDGDATLVTVVHGRPPDGRSAFQDPRGPWWGELLVGLDAPGLAEGTPTPASRQPR